MIAAYITLVPNADISDLGWQDDSVYFKNAPDDGVCRNLLDQSDWLVGLKVCNLLTDLTKQYHALFIKERLKVDFDPVRDFAKCVNNQHDATRWHHLLQIDVDIVFDVAVDVGTVIDGLKVDQGLLHTLFVD